MTEKRVEYARLIGQGVSVSEACRRLGVDRKTGHWWKNGGTITRNGITRFVEPIINRQPARADSPRFLSERERVVTADGVHAGKSAQDRGRAGPRRVDGEPRAATHPVHRRRVSIPRRAGDDAFAPPTPQGPASRERRRASRARAALPRPTLEPEQIVHELEVTHGRRIAVETLY